MDKPVFSVVIATHNRQDILPKAIDSILKQTLNDFELIVVDNGSTDNTRSVVNGIGDARVRYVLNDCPTNSCDVPRNIGMRMAQGEIVAFLDDDDIWYPERLEKVKKAFDEHPEAACVCHAENIRAGGVITKALLYGPWTDDIYEKLLYENNLLSSCGTSIRRDALVAFNGFDERERRSEVADYDLWIRMAQEGLKTFFIDEPLGEFTVTGKNWSTVNPFFSAKLVDMIAEHIKGYEQKPLPHISKRGAWRLFQLHAIAARHFAKKGRPRETVAHTAAALLFMVRRPSIISEFYRKVRSGRI